MKFINYVLLASVLMSAGLDGAKKSKNDDSSFKRFKHAIQLQLADALGFPVDSTQFWVNLDIVKHGPQVTIHVPLVNFQTGQQAINPIGVLPFVPGGYLITTDGFLPKELRPNTLVPVSTVGASNNGMSPIFSLAEPAENAPQPPAGYIVQITNGGELQIQCAGTFGNIIPPGPQILMPCSLTYIAEQPQRVSENVTLSTGATNTTHWTGGADKAVGTGVRDTHIIDAVNGIVGWAWADNSMIVDKTNNTSNTMVCIGKIKNGKIKARAPIQLTHNPVGTYVFSTAVAINRTNPNNIVVSWGLSNLPTIPYRAVSFDGGLTWPINGPTNIQPTGTGGAGDNRGVAVDAFGNFWYSTTNAFDNAGKQIDQPTFWVSTDGGVTFSVAYTAPIPAPFDNDVYDFPQFNFGGDVQAGTYGLYYVVDQVGPVDGVQAIGFIPVTGAGLAHIGTGSIVSLNNPNTNSTAFIAVAKDRRLWTFGIPNVYANSAAGATYAAYTSIVPHVINFQPSGALGENIVGSWDVGMNRNSGLEYSGYFAGSDQKAQPYFGFFDSPIIFDEKRQALYVMYCGPVPYFSQSMRVYLVISRDNGLTWSDPIVINDTDCANRGFPSLALDPVTGDLVFGWYDGRNDRRFESVEYMAAVIPATKLDTIVKCIPLSNPTFS